MRDTVGTTLRGSLRRSLALAALALLGVAGCQGAATGPSAGLAAARSRWAQHAPAAYSMTVTRSCECTAEMGGPVNVTVVGGAIQSRNYVASGAEVTAQYAALFPSVDQLFALIDAAIRSGQRPLVAEYDRTLGYPTRFGVGDPALDAPVYLVSDFQAR